MRLCRPSVARAARSACQYQTSAPAADACMGRNKRMWNLCIDCPIAPQTAEYLSERLILQSPGRRRGGGACEREAAAGGRGNLLGRHGAFHAAKNRRTIILTAEGVDAVWHANVEPREAGIRGSLCSGERRL